MLSDEQIERRKELCLDVLQGIENEQDLLNAILLVMKLGYLCMIQKPSDNAVEVNIISKTKKSTSRSKFKAMLIVFFDIQGIVMAVWVPSGQMVNQQFYIEVLMKLREHVRRKRPELWRTGGFYTKAMRQPTMHCL